MVDFKEVFGFAALVILGGEFALMIGSLENYVFSFGGNIARSFLVI